MKITKKYVEPKIRFHKLKGSKILAGSIEPRMNVSGLNTGEEEEWNQ